MVTWITTITLYGNEQETGKVEFIARDNNNDDKSNFRVSDSH